MKIIKRIKAKLHPSKIKTKILQFTLKGNDVECICCGGKFLTFLPAGIIKRANAKCPKCGALERHRTIWMFFKNETNLFSSKLDVLNVAPEKLFYKKLNSIKNISYISIDLQPESYDYGSKTIAMDLTDLKFEEKSFDVIICNHVLEHIPNDAKAMSEMFRVLRQDGWAVINVPVNNNSDTTIEDLTINDPIKQLELYGQPDHVRVYGKDYVTRLENAGFKVKVIPYTKAFTHNERFKFGFKLEENIYLCTK